MTNRFFIFLICSFCAVGCLSQTTEKTEVDTTPAETQGPLVDLHLSLEKPIYGTDEPVPLDITIQVGKFDLLVPYTAVEGRGAFTKLVVKDATGTVVTPKPPITFPSKTKTLMRKDKEVRCVQGSELKAGTTKKAILEDLQTYYKLGPGDYMLQVFMNLRVYREVFSSQPPEVLAIKREIAVVQKDRDMPDDMKQRMIRNLQIEIEAVQRGEGGELDGIYLPLDSYRGLAELESNTVSLTVQ